MPNDLSLAQQLIKKSLENQDPYLDLGRCGVTDLDKLPSLFLCTHLETLILSDSWSSGIAKSSVSSNDGACNVISAIPAKISSLKKLKKLIITSRHPKPLDISFLENLSQLEYLDLSYQQITDASPLAHLTQLQSLFLHANKINDISFLTKLTQLQSLTLSWNQIMDLSPLAHLLQLRSLFLFHNAHPITNLSFLENLIQLQHLDCSENQIRDTKTLTSLTELTYFEAQ